MSSKEKPPADESLSIKETSAEIGDQFWTAVPTPAEETSGSQADVIAEALTNGKATPITEPVSAAGAAAVSPSLNTATPSPKSPASATVDLSKDDPRDWYSSASRRRPRVSSRLSMNDAAGSPGGGQVIPPPPANLAQLRRKGSAGSWRAMSPNPDASNQTAHSPSNSLSGAGFLPSLPGLLESGNGKTYVGPVPHHARQTSTSSTSDLKGRFADGRAMVVSPKRSSVSLVDESLARVAPPRPPRPESGSSRSIILSSSPVSNPRPETHMSLASQGFSSDSESEDGATPRKRPGSRSGTGTLTRGLRDGLLSGSLTHSNARNGSSRSGSVASSLRGRVEDETDVNSSGNQGVRSPKQSTMRMKTNSLFSTSSMNEVGKGSTYEKLSAPSRELNGISATGAPTNGAASGSKPSGSLFRRLKSLGKKKKDSSGDSRRSSISSTTPSLPGAGTSILLPSGSTLGSLAIRRTASPEDQDATIKLRKSPLIEEKEVEGAAGTVRAKKVDSISNDLKLSGAPNGIPASSANGLPGVFQSPSNLEQGDLGAIPGETPRQEHSSAEQAFQFPSKAPEAAPSNTNDTNPATQGRELEEALEILHARRKSSSSSRSGASSGRLGFTHSVFGEGSMDGHSQPATPGFEQSYGQIVSKNATSLSRANSTSSAKGLNIEHVTDALNSRFAAVSVLPPLANGGLKYVSGGSRSRSGSINSATFSPRTYGANLHLRAGSIRSIQPSLIGSDADAASVLSTTSPGVRREQQEEENFWSAIGQSQYEAGDDGLENAGQANGYPARPRFVRTTTDVRSLPLASQLAHLDEVETRALLVELARREIWWELANVHQCADGSLPLLSFVLRKQPGGERFFYEAILPIAEAAQKKNLSAYQDRHGEGDRTRFSALSTTRCLLEAAVSCFARIFAFNFAGWTPVIELPKLDFDSMMFLPYRLPIEQLRNGGFEVDIVAARAAAYVLRIRRPRRWDNYIFRTEQHFHALRKNLVKEFGPKMPLPEIPGAPAEGPRQDGYDEGSIRSGKSPQSFQASRSRNVSSRQASEIGPIEENGNSSEEDDVPQGKPRSKAARKFQEAAFAGPAVKLLANKESKETIAQWPSKADMLARPTNKKAARMIGRAPSTSSPPESIRSLKLKSESKINLSLADGDESLTAERALRARDLRKWLRAVLAVRGVGHSQSMQAFLTTGKLLETDLKKERAAVMDGIAAQDGKAILRMRTAKQDARDAGEMHEEVTNLARRFMEGDEFLRLSEYSQSCYAFRLLPRDYQLLAKYMASQAAHLIYGIYVSGDHSRSNLTSSKAFLKMMPWETIASSMRSPRFAMVKQIQARMLQRRFVQSMLDLFLQDDVASLDSQLKKVRLTVRSNTAERKLRNFVEAPESFQTMVRKSAYELDIPLVVAIVRGSDNPCLNQPTLDRVIAATKSYQAFMATRPNAIQKATNIEVGYRLIRDLQHMLRIYSQWSDGKKIRSMISDAKVADAIAALFQPLIDLLTRLQMVSDSEDKLLELVDWIEELLNLCDSLRVHIQDPARSVAAIASHVEKGIQSGYAFLHQVALDAPDLLPFQRIFSFLQDLRSDGATFDLLAAAEEHARAQANEAAAPSSSAAKEPSPPGDLREMAAELDNLGRKHVLRKQEIFGRWIVGDCEEEHSILTFGDMAGKTRKEPFFPRELPARLHMPALDRLLPVFRDASKSALDALGIAS